MTTAPDDTDPEMHAHRNGTLHAHPQGRLAHTHDWATPGAPPRLLPSPDAIYGSDPDFTGGLESVEYLRRLRATPSGGQEA